MSVEVAVAAMIAFYVVFIGGYNYIDSLEGAMLVLLGMFICCFVMVVSLS
jgi:hypothetical protein